MHDYNVSQIFHLKLIYLYQTLKKYLLSSKISFLKEKKISKKSFKLRKSLCKI